jgi:hypothetical protein
VGSNGLFGHLELLLNVIHIHLYLELCKCNICKNTGSLLFLCMVLPQKSLHSWFALSKKYIYPRLGILIALDVDNVQCVCDTRNHHFYEILEKQLMYSHLSLSHSINTHVSLKLCIFKYVISGEKCEGSGGVTSNATF